MLEGRDDWFVIKALLRADGADIRETGNRAVHELRWRDKRCLLEVSDHETEPGVSNLLSSLPVRVKQSGLERLAVVLDADDGLASRWQSLVHTLGAAGYATPKSPPPSGVLCAAVDRPCVGVWIMPDNTLPGMLEDFVSDLIPNGDPLLPAVDEHIDRLPDCPTRFRPRHRSKARIHSWLAVQLEPGKPLGLAITMRYLQASAPAARGFLDWLDRTIVGVGGP